MYPRSQIKDPRLATNVIMQVVHVFAINGRAFPIAPMLSYSCWAVLVVSIIKWRVDDFSKYKELLALHILFRR